MKQSLLEQIESKELRFILIEREYSWTIRNKIFRSFTDKVSPFWALIVKLIGIHASGITWPPMFAPV